jgi:hypothetical protein
MLDLALDNRIFLNSELDCAIQEMDLIFNTNNTELLGDVTYGTELETFLWTLTPVTSELEKYLREKLTNDTYYVSKLNFDISVEFLQGEYRSVYLIKITLTD